MNMSAVSAGMFLKSFRVSALNRLLPAKKKAVKALLSVSFRQEPVFSLKAAVFISPITDLILTKKLQSPRVVVQRAAALRQKNRVIHPHHPPLLQKAKRTQNLNLRPEGEVFRLKIAPEQVSRDIANVYR